MRAFSRLQNVGLVGREVKIPGSRELGGGGKRFRINELAFSMQLLPE